MTTKHLSCGQRRSLGGDGFPSYRSTPGSQGELGKCYSQKSLDTKVDLAAMRLFDSTMLIFFLLKIGDNDVQFSLFQVSFWKTIRVLFD